VRALVRAFAVASAALVAFSAIPVAAEEVTPVEQVIPAPFTSAIALKRQAWRFQRLAEQQAAATAAQPKLTNDVLAAYLERKQQLAQFDGFNVVAQPAAVTEDMLMGYIAKRRNDALTAIESVDATAKPALTSAVLMAYAEKGYTPTVKKVKLADDEMLCLTQAIYHEARGESREGQLAVANVIINRAMSKKYPSTICGVVFQNADKGRYKCQFTFACDGRSDMGRERTAWNRSAQMAEDAFYEFQKGDRPGVIPDSALFYHTTAVAPRWSHTFHRVAAIGSHVFYSQN
jgi:spore germination cell wall hydrolase CwlJ-like protein